MTRALCGVMPAAADGFPPGSHQPGSHKLLPYAQSHNSSIECSTPKPPATVRTLVEQSRMTIGLPAVKELPWLDATETPKDATRITDPDHDFIPAGQNFVKSDTGELVRDWEYGIQTIDSPKTQAVSGSIGGKTFKLGAAIFRFDTPSQGGRGPDQPR